MSRTERPEPRREDGKIFVLGHGWIDPDVCLPSWCAEGTGGHCAAYGCRKQRKRKRKDRQK